MTPLLSPFRRPALVIALGAALAMASPATIPSAAADDGVSDMVGLPTEHRVRGEETFVALMARYDVGYTELVAANPGVDPWIPKPGTVLDIPTVHLLPQTPHRGIVINLADQRLYWFGTSGGPVQSFPIGIGREGWGTPLGETKVVRKRKDPAWTPPASIREEKPDLPRVVAAGPDNPLGAYALDLAWDAYLIHGTNKPGGIGRRVSHGCIRLPPDDIARLFAAAPVGTPVTIVNEPVKVGRAFGALWLEVHPTQQQADQLEETGSFTPTPAPGAGTRILAAAGGEVNRIDWSAVRTAIAERRGIPVRISRSGVDPDG